LHAFSFSSSCLIMNTWDNSTYVKWTLFLIFSPHLI
jgi:hypothetical protein